MLIMISINLEFELNPWNSMPFNGVHDVNICVAKYFCSSSLKFIKIELGRNMKFATFPKLEALDIRLFKYQQVQLKPWNKSEVVKYVAI